MLGRKLRGHLIFELLLIMMKKFLPITNIKNVLQFIIIISYFLKKMGRNDSQAGELNIK